MGHLVNELQRQHKACRCILPEKIHDCDNRDIQFHILVAAYNASDSIVPVINAIGNQDYPAELFDAWIITEKNEQQNKDKQLSDIVTKTLNCAKNGEIDQGLIPLLWKCQSSKYPMFGDWLDQLSHGVLRAFFAYPNAYLVFLEELITHLGLEYYD